MIIFKVLLFVVTEYPNLTVEKCASSTVTYNWLQLALFVFTKPIVLLYPGLRSIGARSSVFWPQQERSRSTEILDCSSAPEFFINFILKWFFQNVENGGLNGTLLLCWFLRETRRDYLKILIFLPKFMWIHDTGFFKLITNVICKRKASGYCASPWKNILKTFHVKETEGN